MKLFSYIVIAVVGISIIAGFFVLGTPKEERMRRFDSQRISDLQTIQWQVINYWQAKGKLPESLSTLVDETQGVRPPIDPETGTAYEYKIIDEEKLTFELCANFKTQNSASEAEDVAKSSRSYGPYGPEPVNWNWQHGADRTCFERTIDPDTYKPFPEKIRD